MFVSRHLYTHFENKKTHFHNKKAEEKEENPWSVRDVNLKLGHTQEKNNENCWFVQDKSIMYDRCHEDTGSYVTDFYYICDWMT